MAKQPFVMKISQQDYDSTISNRYTVLKKYGAEERILVNIFALYSQFNFAEVMTRITLLNQFYSTAIMDLRSVADRILSLPNVEADLKAGNIEVVEQIATINHKGKPWHHNSFASKLANFHNNDAFPIMDSLVVEVLCKLRAKGFFVTHTKFSAEKLRTDYKFYKDVYDEFIVLSGIDRLMQDGRKLNYKDVDNYLWSSRKVKGLSPLSQEAQSAPTEYNQIVNNIINSI